MTIDVLKPSNNGIRTATGGKIGLNVPTFRLTFDFISEHRGWCETLILM